MDDDTWAGLRPAVRMRLRQAVAKLRLSGTLNRKDIETIGEVSTPQASVDLREIIARCPGLMRYDRSLKTYVLETDREGTMDMEVYDEVTPASLRELLSRIDRYLGHSEQHGNGQTYHPHHPTVLLAQSQRALEDLAYRAGVFPLPRTTQGAKP